MSDLRPLEIADPPSIPEYDHTVGAALQFVQPMRDKHHTNALCLQIGDESMSRSVSESVRLDVGSSMMTSREFSDRAFTISSI